MAGGSSRQGGKLKPKKAPKKDVTELSEEEEAHRLKMKKDAEELKMAREAAKGKSGPLVGGGIKKSGGKK